MAEPALRQLQKMCVSLASSVCVFSVLYFVLDAQNELMPPTLRSEDALPQAAAVAAVLLLIVSSKLQRWMTPAPTLRNVAEPSTDALEIRALIPATIVSFAVREAAATIGFLLSLLTKDPVWVVGLGICTLCSMSLAWPTTARLQLAKRSR